MKFWDDGQKDSTRIRNVNFSWRELKRFASFLKKNGIDVDFNLYDFSPEKIIEDAIHIPYPLGVYKKAEKTNIILKEKSNFDFFMMMDCDAFFCKDDYDLFLNLYRELEIGDIVTFDLAKLNDSLSEYIVDGEFIKEKADFSYAYSGARENGPLAHHIGGLGGVYLCDTKLLLELGGFDEKYTGWGGEDGDKLDKIWQSKTPHRFKPTKNFAPFHLPHFSDWSNVNYSRRFEE
jgi:predicted glycosyltransferase involved in capsule biosynthesis